MIKLKNPRPCKCKSTDIKLWLGAELVEYGPQGGAQCNQCGRQRWIWPNEVEVVDVVRVHVVTAELLLVDRGSSGEFGWHGLKQWLKCPRLGAFNEVGNEGDPVEYHVRGNLGHVALAHLYKNDPRYFSPEAAAHAYAERHPTEYNAKWLPRVEAMLAAYRQRYNGDKAWKTLGVEEVIKIKVKGTERFPDTGSVRDAVEVINVSYSARYDLCVEWKGLVYFVDHKLMFNVIPSVVESYRLDGQILGLNLCGRAKWGAKFGGVILNCIRLTDKDIDFKRPPMVIPPPVIADFKQTILEAHRVRRRWTGKEPMSVPGVFGEACLGKYKCSHRRICGRES